MSELNLTPDWYTKVLLSPDGRVLNADFLEPNDLPEHRHKLEEIDGDLEGKIFEALSHFFANNIDSAVIFNYDDKNKVITADLRYDGLTIDKNEDGELVSYGGSGEGGGVSIPECVTHSHKHTDIEDWEEALKDYIDLHPINIDMSRYVDNTTIIINNEGKLSSIGSGVVKHKHKIEDIEDFPDILPANIQPLNASEISYVQGPVDFTDLTIGQAIIALNYYEGLQDDRIDRLAEQLNRITVGQGGNSGSVTSTIKIDETCVHKNLIHKSSGKIKDVYLNERLSVLVDTLPYEHCSITMMIDGNEVETVRTQDISFGYVNGHFYCKEIRPNNTRVIGYYLNAVNEGEHSLQFKYDLGETIEYSEKISINVCNKKKYRLSLIDINPTHIIRGTQYYDKGFEGFLTLVAEDYNGTIYSEPALFLDGTGSFKFKVDDLNNIPSRLTFENLFEITTVDVPLNKEVEFSDSFIYKNQIESQGCYFVNNVLTPISRGNLKFKVPNTKRVNGLKIFGLNNVVQLKVYKGNEFISKNTLFNLNDEDNKGGVVQLEDGEDCLTMAFNNIYDSGKNDLVVYIDFVYPIDTTKVEIIPLR